MFCPHNRVDVAMARNVRAVYEVFDPDWMDVLPNAEAAAPVLATLLAGLLHR